MRRMSRLEGSLLCRFGIANAVAAVVSLITGTLLAPIRDGTRVGAFGATDLIAFAIYLPVTGAIGGIIGARLYRRSCGWVDEDRVPTERERSALLHLPAAFVIGAFPFWVGAALLFGGIALFDRHDGVAAFAVSTRIIDG